MNKKQITGLVLVAGLLVGGFGLKAMAEEAATTTPSTQTERPARGFGGFMRGMRGQGGFGGFGGFFDNELTTEEQKELNRLRAEAQNVMVDYREEMIDLRTALNEAIDGADQTAILSAWDKLAALHETIQTELTPVREKITSLVGSEDFPIMGTQFEDSYLAEQMDALRSADGEAAKAIIDNLQVGCGQGGFNQGMGRGFGRGMGRGGRMMNPGQNTDRPYRGNGL